MDHPKKNVSISAVTVNLISENSDTGGIGKFHRCHWWWVMKLFTQPLVLCLLLNDPPLLKQYRIHLYIPLYVNIIQFKPTKNLVTMKLHRKFYKANISFVERLLQWEFGYLWSQRWKFCHRWLRHKCHRVTAVNTDFNQHFFFEVPFFKPKTYEQNVRPHLQMPIPISTLSIWKTHFSSMPLNLIKSFHAALLTCHIPKC